MNERCNMPWSPSMVTVVLPHAGMSDKKKDDFRLGMNAVLDYLEGFGWDSNGSRPVWPSLGHDRCTAGE